MNQIQDFQIQEARDEIGGKQYAEYLMGWEQI